MKRTNKIELLKSVRNPNGTTAKILDLEQERNTLAKENKVMRGTIQFALRVIPDHIGFKNDRSVFIEALKCDTTNLIVLTRDELIAEIEKMPCGCLDTRNNFEKVGYLITCARCQWLARETARGEPRPTGGGKC